MSNGVKLPKPLVRLMYILRRRPKDREDFLSFFRDMPEDKKEWLYDLREMLDVVPTGEDEWKAEREDRVYDYLLTTFREGKPINKDEAELLVRCHAMMPFPFSSKEGRLEYIEYPPSVIQAYLNSSGFEARRKALTLYALCSFEGFEKIKATAEISPSHFDALHDAAILATYPDRQFALQFFPTTDHLRLWKYNVDRGRTTCQTGSKPGPNKFQNLARNVFFYLIVEDLSSCGLWKSVNDEADMTAFSVVAEVVYGKKGSRNTIKSGYDVVKKMRSERREGAEAKL